MGVEVAYFAGIEDILSNKPGLKKLSDKDLPRV
jgi:hypothetical protein